MITWSLDWAEYMDLIGTCSSSPSIPFAPLVPSLDVLSSCYQPTSQKVLLDRALASAECYAQMTGLPLLSIDTSRQTLGSGSCSGTLSDNTMTITRSAASSPTRALLLHATTDSTALIESPPVWNPSVVMDSPPDDAEETLALSRHLFSSDHSSFTLGSEPLNDSMLVHQTSTATDSEHSRKRTATETSYSLMEESLLSFASPEPQRYTNRKIPRTSSPETLC